MLMPNNQNELAFQLWWFACYGHGCLCSACILAWSQKEHVLQYVFADNDLWWGEEFYARNAKERDGNAVV
jgi:hypothetical protein